MSTQAHPIGEILDTSVSIHKLLLPTIETPDFGTVSLTQVLLDRWNADGKGLVGWPIANSFGLAGGGSAIYCESGMIVAPKAGGTFIVHGRIYLKYRDLGDVHGWVGLPTADEAAAANGGRVSHFANADIYWSGGTDAHEVHGAIRARYEALGGAGGFLGYPFTDETPVMNGGTEVGRFNRFQGGVIYWSAATDAWEVHGAIRDAWENSHKGAIGELGFPVSNETSSNGDNYRYNDFQNGTMIWSKADGSITVLTKLEFYLDGFNTKGDDGFLGGGQDLYVKFHVQTSGGNNFVKRMPNDGDYGADEQIAQVMFTESPMRGGTVIHLMIEGWDSDTFSDDQLGTVDKFYTIDNMWGMNEDASHWVGDFEARYKLRPVVNFDTTKFRENYFWKFHNFETAELSWGQFAETFSDVDNDESTVWHPFDHLFYSLVYKGVAAGGNCFGMCWESIFAQMGHSIYREPIAIVPPTNGSDPNPTTNHEVIDDINIKHGYQVSGQMVDYFVPMFLSGRTHDPKSAFADSRNQWNAGDYPVIALTDKSLGVSGHVVRPYAWDDSVKPWRIYVCDPNQPLVSGADPRNTFIEIDPDANTFSFRMAGGSVWSGGTWSGGRCYSIPHHVVCSQPRTPFWEVLALLAGGALLILGGDGKTQQIRDSAGRTFYKDGLANGPANWEDLQDDAHRIPNFSRIAMLHQVNHILTGHLTDHIHLGEILAANRLPEMYWATSPRPKPGTLNKKVDGTIVHLSEVASSVAALRLMQLHNFAVTTPVPMGSLEIEIAQGSGAYSWGVRTPVASHVVNVPAGKASKDSVLLENAGRAQQAVTVMPDTDKQVGIIIVGGSPQTNDARTFSVANLGLKAGARVRTHLDPATGALVVENPGDATSLDIQVSASASVAAPVRTKVPIAANSVTRFAPDTWTPASMGTVKIKMEALDPSTGTARSTTEI